MELLFHINYCIKLFILQKWVPLGGTGIIVITVELVIVDIPLIKN